MVRSLDLLLARPWNAVRCPLLRNSAAAASGAMRGQPQGLLAGEGREAALRQVTGILLDMIGILPLPMTAPPGGRQ